MHIRFRQGSKHKQDFHPVTLFLKQKIHQKRSGKNHLVKEDCRKLPIDRFIPFLFMKVGDEGNV